MEDTYAGCVHCRSSAREDVLLICDLCGDYWHTYCLPTPLSAVPEGDFYCPRCEEMPAPVNSHISDEDYEPSANLEEEEEKKDELEQYIFELVTSKESKETKDDVVDSDDESESDESIDEEDDEEELIDVISPPRRSRKKKKIKKKKQLPHGLGFQSGDNYYLLILNYSNGINRSTINRKTVLRPTAATIIKIVWIVNHKTAGTTTLPKPRNILVASLTRKKSPPRPL